MIQVGGLLSLRVTWKRWRALLLPLGLGLLVALNRLTNPWDFLLAADSMKMVALIIVPLYLLIGSRDPIHAWEPLVSIRLGNTVTWWWSDVLSCGVSAILVSVGLGVVTILVPFATNGWSWHWGTYTQAQQLVGIGTIIPWHWAIDALGLLALGLWASGVFVHVLTLWWRSAWLPLVFLLLLELLPIIFASSSATRVIIWWIPGPQFSLGAHFSSLGTFPPLWSFGYALLMLSATVGVGALVVGNYPWETIPHGSL